MAGLQHSTEKCAIADGLQRPLEEGRRAVGERVQALDAQVPGPLEPVLLQQPPVHDRHARARGQRRPQSPRELREHLAPRPPRPRRREAHRERGGLQHLGHLGVLLPPVHVPEQELHVAQSREGVLAEAPGPLDEGRDYLQADAPRDPPRVEYAAAKTRAPSPAPMSRKTSPSRTPTASSSLASASTPSSPYTSWCSSSSRASTAAADAVLAPWEGHKGKGGLGVQRRRAQEENNLEDKAHAARRLKGLVHAPGRTRPPGLIGVATRGAEPSGDHVCDLCDAGWFQLRKQGGPRGQEAARASLRAPPATSLRAPPATPAGAAGRAARPRSPELDPRQGRGAECPAHGLVAVGTRGASAR
eukprot:CAMPEP_0182900598 /NCGR_PEP_ID=MMETSP0034_2-20130328/28972_1 /TAXON_ID=156128 /ORGANISM="Nephroselmis pyriformis, Strain CCMP717" /LENGTH=358 /DNA_ID=CAMNT_0025034837 /DNA_START=39 /DNA_END=1117 /DNA_ORIENTATION=-